MITVNSIIELKKKHPQIASDVTDILIRSLSPTQRRIFDLLGEKTCLTSRELAVNHGMIQTTAAQAMREMHDMGILVRKTMPGSGSPNKFVYWRAA